MHTDDRKFCWQRLAVLLATALLFHGCAPAGPAALDIPAFEEAARLDIDTFPALCWDEAEKRLLVSGEDLRIISLPSARERLLFARPAEAAAWSPGGERIAASDFNSGEPDETRVRIFSSESGEVLDSRTIPGRVSNVFWASPNEVLVASAELKVYSFGGGLRFFLHRFEPGADISSTVLSDATVKPGTVAYLGSRYERVLHADLSAYRDEMIYTRFHDPPEAYPYLRLVAYHLGTGERRVVDKLPLDSAGAVFAANAEEVYYDAGRQGVVQKRPWAKEDAEFVAGADAAGQIDAAGAYLLVGNRLYRGGGLVATLPAGAVYSLSPAGRYLAAAQDTVLQIFGLPAVSSDPLPQLGEEAMDKLLWLRRWRSQGLISPAEYRQRKQRMVHP